MSMNCHSMNLFYELKLGPIFVDSSIYVFSKKIDYLQDYWTQVDTFQTNKFS